MPEDPLFSISRNDVIRILSRRTDVSILSPEEIEQACLEVAAILETELDVRPYIEMGLDVWSISRTL